MMRAALLPILLTVLAGCGGGDAAKKQDDGGTHGRLLQSVCEPLTSIGSKPNPKKDTQAMVRAAEAGARRIGRPLGALERASPPAARLAEHDELVKAARQVIDQLEELARVETSSLGTRVVLAFDDVQAGLRVWERRADCRLDPQQAVDALRTGHYQSERFASVAYAINTINELYGKDPNTLPSAGKIRDAVTTLDYNIENLDLMAVPRVVRREHRETIAALKAFARDIAKHAQLSPRIRPSEPRSAIWRAG